MSETTEERLVYYATNRSWQINSINDRARQALEGEAV